MKFHKVYVKINETLNRKIDIFPKTLVSPEYMLGGYDVNIYMLGIDHNHASIEEREIFSLTKNKTVEFLEILKEVKEILGCVIISTCNRLELWLSISENFNGAIYDVLCKFKNIDGSQYKDCFVERRGYEAVEHLFYLACGLKSRIIGEDQILTQVKEALELSRENYCTNNVIETLFRMAITSAKKIKTEVHLEVVNSSIAHHVVHKLYTANNIEFYGKKCLVIGNGKIGKLTATKLMEEGANVTVTIRQYKSGVIEIPIGCNRINYGERYNQIEDYDIIISATASPNITLTYEHMKLKKFKKPVLIIDLAVPRDVDSEVGKLKNITLYDIDHFQVDTQSEKMKEQLLVIQNIIKTQIDEFELWYKGIDYIPILQSVGDIVADDVIKRVSYLLKKINCENKENEISYEVIHKATDMAVRKLLYYLRDNINSEAFKECMEALRKEY